MKTIVVYSTTADVPEHLRHVAYFRDGKDFLPLRISGPSEEAVRKKAETWWVEEAARQNKRRGTGTNSPSVKPDDERIISKSPASTFDEKDVFEDILG